jgi:hypothetical protein
MVDVNTRNDRRRGFARNIGRRLAAGYEKIRRRLSSRRRG